MSITVGQDATMIQTGFSTRQRQIAADQAIEEAERRQEKEKSKKSIYQDFAQLNRQNIIHLIKAAQVNPTALAVLLFIIEHMDRMNALVCSYTVLQEQLNLSKATITRSIKYLKETGFIYIYKSGTSNVYVVNDDLVWTNHGDKAKYCKFPATVILSASEQTAMDDDLKLKHEYNKSIKEKGDADKS